MDRLGPLAPPLRGLRAPLLRRQPPARLRRRPRRGLGARPGPRRQVDPLRDRLHPRHGRGGALRPAAPRQQPLPARPDDHGRGGAGGPRLRDAHRPEGVRPPRVLLQLLLAAQDRVLLPLGHPPAAVPHRLLELPRVARGLPAPRLLPRQAVLLLVGLRLRRPRQHLRRALPPPLQQVEPGLVDREGLDPLGALPRPRHHRRSSGSTGRSAGSTRPSPASPSPCRTGTASPSGRCSRASSGWASTRSWAPACGAGSAARWRRSSASSRSSAASASP